MSFHDLVNSLCTSMTIGQCKELDIIPWSSPVPFFGDCANSKIASVGINPSNYEFFNANGEELEYSLRRFETLNSLGLDSWEGLTKNQIEKVIDSYVVYFENNPYKKWFNAIDIIFRTSGFSFYKNKFSTACHIDITPFTTNKKWSKVEEKKRSELLGMGEHVIPNILDRTNLRILVLNGKSVINQFSNTYKIEMKRVRMENWDLPRKNGEPVEGYKYIAVINKIGDIKLKRNVMVYGFNHNIQSSFGVTREVRNSISLSLRSSIKHFL